MSEAPKITLTHFAICVSDLERSARFYTEGLGFTRTVTNELGKAFETLTELKDLQLRMTFLQRDGFTLELLHTINPPAFGSTERRPMNQLGFTHMTFAVEDVDAAADRIVAFGGQVHSVTRTKDTYGEFIYCTDPDGVRIELWASPH